MAAMGAIDIRPAEIGDAERLAQLGAATFAEAFGHIYPEGDLAAHLAEAHSPDNYAATIANPAFRVWIAMRDDEAVGYALAGPCHLPHPEVTPACGELWRLYVRQGLQGAGLGGRLLDQALGWLEAPGRRLWLGVWSENYGAQRLYARHGFAKVGEYHFRVGASRDLDFIFARPATTSALDRRAQRAQS
jgi:ribosomal protein S18 acetylase RimI-like enzyme